MCSYPPSPLTSKSLNYMIRTLLPSFFLFPTPSTYLVNFTLPPKEWWGWRTVTQKILVHPWRQLSKESCGRGKGERKGSKTPLESAKMFISCSPIIVQTRPFISSLNIEFYKMGQIHVPTDFGLYILPLPLSGQVDLQKMVTKPFLCL